jgi:hypothetical protein
MTHKKIIWIGLWRIILPVHDSQSNARPCGRVACHILLVWSSVSDILYQSILSMTSCSSQYIAHVVIWLTIYCTCGHMAHHILHMWSYGSPYIAHMVSMSQHILPVWSERIPYNSMWSSVSRYIAHIVGGLTICCINPCCLHGQYVSAYIAHVVRVYPI